MGMKVTVPGHGGTEIIVASNGERVWLTQPNPWGHDTVTLTLEQVPALQAALADALAVANNGNGSPKTPWSAA